MLNRVGDVSRPGTCSWVRAGLPPWSVMTGADRRRSGGRTLASRCLFVGRVREHAFSGRSRSCRWGTADNHGGPTTGSRYRQGNWPACPRPPETLRPVLRYTGCERGHVARRPRACTSSCAEYYYYKSADWKGNRPFPLKGWTAPELAKMPTYYIMDLDQGVAADDGGNTSLHRRKSSPASG